MVALSCSNIWRPSRGTASYIGIGWKVNCYTGQWWEQIVTTNLVKLRYLSIVSSKFVPVDRLPPTNRACHFHCLKVRHQVSRVHLKTIIRKEDYGFTTDDNCFTPIITDQLAAPEDLLCDFRCSCKSTTCLLYSFHFPKRESLVASTVNVMYSVKTRLQCPIWMMTAVMMNS